MKKIALLILLFSISGFSQSTEKQGDIYDTKGLEVQPEYPEGLEKLNAYINEKLHASAVEAKPKSKSKTKEKPRVYAQFVIEKDGSLSNIKILGKTNPALAEQVTNILKNLPKWYPGKQNNTLVRVMYVLPIILDN